MKKGIDFKVGDKVRIAKTGDDSTFDPAFAGQSGTIIAIEENDATRWRQLCKIKVPHFGLSLNWGEELTKL